VAERRPQSPTSATLENGVANRSWLCGPGADIVAYLKEVERRYPGLDHVMIGWAIGTPRAMMIEQLTRFAREVMPAFRARGPSSRGSAARGGSAALRGRRA